MPDKMIAFFDSPKKSIFTYKDEEVISFTIVNLKVNWSEEIFS